MTKEETSYYATVRLKSPEKYKLIMSFDKNKEASISKYKEFVIDLFQEASDLIVELGDEQSKKILNSLGYFCLQSNNFFLNRAFNVIDEDNFTNIQYRFILKAERFINECKKF
jgi:hypothetical protein